MLPYMKRGQARNSSHHVVSIRTSPAGWLTVRCQRRHYIVRKFVMKTRLLAIAAEPTR